jgi:hypothetical protein
VARDLFSEPEPGRFTLTDSVAPLCDDHPEQLRSWLDLTGALGRADLAFDAGDAGRTYVRHDGDRNREILGFYLQKDNHNDNPALIDLGAHRDGPGLTPGGAFSGLSGESTAITSLSPLNALSDLAAALL